MRSPDEIRAACAETERLDKAAAKGPWTVVRDRGDHWGMVEVEGPGVCGRVVVGFTSATDLDERERAFIEPTADFIAASRTLFPPLARDARELVDEVERLRESIVVEKSWRKDAGDAQHAAERDRDEALTAMQAAQVARDRVTGEVDEFRTRTAGIGRRDTEPVWGFVERLRGEAETLREALRVIWTAARDDEYGQHHAVRAWLTKRGIYSGDVTGGEGDPVIAMVCAAALAPVHVPGHTPAARPDTLATLDAVRAEGAPPHEGEGETTEGGR